MAPSTSKCNSSGGSQKVHYPGMVPSSSRRYSRVAHKRSTTHYMFVPWLSFKVPCVRCSPSWRVSKIGSDVKKFVSELEESLDEHWVRELAVLPKYWVVATQEGDQMEATEKMLEAANMWREPSGSRLCSFAVMF